MLSVIFHCYAGSTTYLCGQAERGASELRRLAVLQRGFVGLCCGPVHPPDKEGKVPLDTACTLVVEARSRSRIPEELTGARRGPRIAPYRQGRALLVTPGVYRHTSLLRDRDHIGHGRVRPSGEHCHGKGCNGHGYAGDRFLLL